VNEPARLKEAEPEGRGDDDTENAPDDGHATDRHRLDPGPCVCRSGYIPAALTPLQLLQSAESHSESVGDDVLITAQLISLVLHTN